MQQVTEIPKLKPRAADAHKGDFGKVCIVAGSVGMSGAAALAGTAALRAGAGLVRVAVPDAVLPIVASIEPSFTTIPLPSDNKGRIAAKAVRAVLAAANDNDVLAFGPGVGIAEGPRRVLEELLRLEGLRLIIDADGLNNLSKIKDWEKTLKASVILTPHPGELKRLWRGLFREERPGERSEQAGRLASQTNSVVVLKGAGTVVTDPSTTSTTLSTGSLRTGGSKAYTNTTGNPGMATAGSGDVLTGVIAALCGQGLNNFDASVLGVYIHGLAGDIAVKELGQVSLIARDLLNYLPKAFMSTHQ
jgi:NAD(P)H-hydrate epimerase